MNGMCTVCIRIVYTKSFMHLRIHIENMSGLFFSLLSIRELLNCIIRDHLHIVLNGAGVCTVFAVLVMRESESVICMHDTQFYTHENIVQLMNNEHGYYYDMSRAYTMSRQRATGPTTQITE